MEHDFDSLVKEIKDLARSVGEPLTTKAARRAARAMQQRGLDMAEAIGEEYQRY